MFSTCETFGDGGNRFDYAKRRFRLYIFCKRLFSRLFPGEGPRPLRTPTRGVRSPREIFPSGPLPVFGYPIGVCVSVTVNAPSPWQPQPRGAGETMKQTKYLLNETDLPRRWYNIAADMPTPMHPPCTRGPGTRSGRRTWRPCFPWR